VTVGIIDLLEQGMCDAVCDNCDRDCDCYDCETDYGSDDGPND